jgi:[ribosomal protein S18]-alanine N-acetyltransferase
MSTPVDVVVEPMREEDLDRVARIDAEALRGGESTAGELPRIVQLREELVRPWARLRVVRPRGQGDAVLGYTLFWHVVDEIHLLDVAVASSHRRRGLGRVLLEDLLAYARTHAAAKVLLEVRVGNAAAIALYRAFHFEDLHVRKRYYDDGEDALEMMLTL